MADADSCSPKRLILMPIIKHYMEEAVLIYNELTGCSKFLGDRLKEKIKEYEKYV